jgi:alpha-tubulin suppressor-like RCC1 family protein
VANYIFQIFIISSLNNKLYGFGDNYLGQLGLNVPKTSEPLPITIPEEGNIKSIAVGSLHTLVLFENGKLWGFGANVRGQLGLGNIRKQTIPRRIELPEGEKVIAIAAGDQDTFVLCENSKNCRTLYGFGQNNVGQLGLGHMSVQTTPQRIILPEGEEPNSIHVGYRTTFVLCKSGIVYRFGYNSKDNTCQTTPQPIVLPPGYKARSVFAVGVSPWISKEPEQTASLNPENQTSFSK